MFRYMFGFTLNVDAARRMIASGDIAALPYAMPVRVAGTKLLGMDPLEFGTAEGDVYPPERSSSDPFSNHVNRRMLAGIPEAAMSQPGLLVMWSPLGSARISSPKANLADLEGQPSFPVLVDGNHRLARRFLGGDTGTMPTLVVREWADIVKVLAYMGRPAIRPARKPGAAAPDGDVPRPGGPGRR